MFYSFILRFASACHLNPDPIRFLGAQCEHHRGEWDHRRPLGGSTQGDGGSFGEHMAGI